MEKIKVLLVSGVVTAEHNYRRQNENLRILLESTGRFTVKINEEFNGASSAMLKDYDLILLNYDGKHMPSDEYKRWNPQTEEVFFDFVKEGKGLVIHHSSIWLDAKQPEEYRKIWGCYASMEDARRYPSDDITVHILETGHPVTKGLKDFSIVGDDFFTGLSWAKETKPTVLAASFDDVEVYRQANYPPAHHKAVIPGGRLENMYGVNTMQPVAWVNEYGRGKIFACSLGHDIDTYRRVNYMTLLVRGAEWAATGEVTLEKPERSGERRFRAWPYY